MQNKVTFTHDMAERVHNTMKKMRLGGRGRSGPLFLLPDRRLAKAIVRSIF